MKNKEKQAISLIVLVITILVLSILAATVIISLSNTNIISEGNNAVENTRGANVEEVKNLWELDVKLGSEKTLEELLDELVQQNGLTEDERDIIIGNELKDIEATGKVTIGDRTIVFFAPSLVTYEVSSYNEEGWNLICVYTDKDNIAYKWKDYVMCDITDSGYTYNGKLYKKIYGYVSTEQVNEDDFTIVDISSTEVIKVRYSYDLNRDGEVEKGDLITVYGVRNGITEYLSDEFQWQLLMADLDKNKVVDQTDCDMIAEACK